MHCLHQVLPIWEGTTNILSLDVLRALRTSHGLALKAVAGCVEQYLSSASNRPDLEKECDGLEAAMQGLLKFAAEDVPTLEIAARDFAFSIARTFIGKMVLLLSTSFFWPYVGFSGLSHI